MKQEISNKDLSPVNETLNLPPVIVWGIFLISVLPFFLTVAGIDFGLTQQTLLQSLNPELGEKFFQQMFRRHLSGELVHALLEWSSFFVSFLVFILSIIHFYICGNIAALIIGVSLLSAGAMDAFLVLASHQLVFTTLDNQYLIPVIWTVSGVFRSCIVLIGAGLFVFLPAAKGEQDKRSPMSLGFLILLGVVLLLSAYGIIDVLANSPPVASLFNPDGWIKRPWELIPIGVILFSALFVFPRFYREFPALFSQALRISLFPQWVSHLHMAFGAEELFDSHFNIAHFLKLVAYGVPMVGIFWDYYYAHFNLKKINRQMEEEIALRRQVEKNLRDSEQRFQNMADNAPVMIWMADEKGNFNFFNQNWMRFTGAGPERQNNQAWLEYVHAQDLNGLKECIREAAAGKREFIYEYRMKRQDGEYRWILNTGIPRFSAKGEIMGFIGSCIDIHERKELEQAKDDLVSTVSHEFRTPITIMREGISQILDGLHGPVSAEQERFLRMAFENVDHLDRMVGDILDLARLESGTIELNRQFFDFAELAGEAAAGMRPQAEAEGLTLTVEKGGERLPVIADRDKLQAVLINLLSNAIKFTDRGSISVVLGADEEHLFCYIRDTGKGIAAKDLPKVFDKFEQFHRMAISGQKGTGLGLSICKRIVDLHQGSIKVESSLGQGSVFFFSIPRGVRPKK